MKILIIDDDPKKTDVILNFICNSCGVAKNDISAVPSVVEAKQALQKVQYDLAILDILLPLRAGNQPSKDHSISLLNEITLTNTLKKPLQIIGLTAYDNLVSHAEPYFHETLWDVLHYDPTSDGWLKSLENCILYLVNRERTSEKSEYNIDLCVLTATPVEAEALHSTAWAWEPLSPLDDTSLVKYGKFVSSSGSSYTVASLHLPRMGMVSAAATTAKVIGILRPRFIVMVGICGGLRVCEFGDVILGNPTWDYQSGKRILENGETKFLAAPHHVRVPSFIVAKADQMREIKKVWSDLHANWPANKPKSIPALHVGPLASGGAVIADGNVTVEIKTTQHRQLLGIEMEAYGLYAAAAEASYPRPTVFAMKAVSDFADESKNDDFQKYAAYTSVNSMRQFFELYMDDIVGYAGSA